jgi:DNA-binding MarR family transcriptional regulator
VTKQAARLMIEELLAAGYVEPSEAPGDARRRPVRPSARGREVLRRSEQIFDALRDELAAQVGPETLASGLRLLGAIKNRYGPVPLRPVW